MNFKKWVKSIQTAGYNGALTVYLLRSAVGRLENLGLHVWGLSRYLKGTGFASVSTNKIGVQVLALSAPPVSQTALQLGLCECVAARHKVFANFKYVKDGGGGGGGGDGSTSWRVTSI